MADKDVIILQEQLDGSLKEQKLTPSVINAQSLTIVSETAPDILSVEDSTIWVRETDLQQFFLFNDGDSRAWVQLPPSPHTHTNGSGAGTIYDSKIPDTVYSTALGGAPSQLASEWKTKSVVDVLDALLFPTIDAIILSNKSLAFSWGTSSTLNDTSVVEVGDTYNLSFNFSFTQGRIKNGDGSTGPVLVGAQSSSATISGPGLSGVNITSGQLFSSISLTSTSNSWVITLPYSAGTGSYFDNKGNSSTNLDASRVSGTITSTLSVTAFYPFYVIKSPVSFSAEQFKTAISTNSATGIHASAQFIKVVSNSSGTLNIPLNINGLYLGVAYPSASGTKTKYYVSSFDGGDITAVFDPVQELSTSGLSNKWTNQNYRYHISSGPITNSTSIMELRN